jgi:hypothetical protein
MSLPLTMEFLALLAYPESDGAQRRSRAIEAMRAYWLRACKDAGTLDRLGPILDAQQMERQLNHLTFRLKKRLVAATDCVNLDMGMTWPVSDKVPTLNDIAKERPTKKYKQDWWRPEVMPLAIALRGVMLGWNERYSENASVHTLLLTWSDWFEQAMKAVPGIADYLVTNPHPALRGFRRTTFLLPGGQSLRFGNQ